MTEKVQVPKGVIEMRNELQSAKDLLRRLEKGQKFIDSQIKSGSIVKAYEGVELFNELAKQLNNKLEDALFMHELIVTGRTVAINRHGKAVTSSQFEANEMTEVDLFSLESIKKLREIFGDDVIIGVEP